MGLVEGVFCKVNHLIVDVVCGLLVNPIVHTALNPFRLAAVDKVLALLLHNRRLFLTHGAAHQIAASHGVSGQITHNLHNLLLVHDASIGGA